MLLLPHKATGPGATKRPLPVARKSKFCIYHAARGRNLSRECCTWQAEAGGAQQRPSLRRTVFFPLLASARSIIMLFRIGSSVQNYKVLRSRPTHQTTQHKTTHPSNKQNQKHGMTKESQSCTRQLLWTDRPAGAAS